MGGEHKLSRGFEPVLVHSAHRFLEPALDGAIARYCALETESRAQELARWREDD
jgi:predicted N-acyltransferase